MGKGADFERHISKMMSLWWTNGERDDVFWRTSQFGGRATIRRQKGKATKNQDGDLCATDPIGQPLIDKATIELKVGYNGWSLKEIIDKQHKCNTRLEEFFEQCERERTSQNKECWALITKQDRRDCLIFINNDFWKFLKRKHEMEVDRLILVHHKFGYIYCMRLQDFFDNVSPGIFNENE